jgi:hypothetical protein
VAASSFLTNHARVLLCVAHDPGVRLRGIAARTGVTERTAYGTVADLTEAGLRHGECPVVIGGSLPRSTSSVMHEIHPGISRSRDAGRIVNDLVNYCWSGRELKRMRTGTSGFRDGSPTRTWAWTWAIVAPVKLQLPLRTPRP